jgi:hypothetical protein
MSDKTIDNFSALATAADDDYVLIWDTSAGATKKIAFSGFAPDLAIIIDGSTLLATPADDDYLLILDTSVNAIRKTPFSAFDVGFVLADGTVALSGDWDIGTGRYIAAEKLRARSSGGLRLEDDAGGLGIYIEDSTGNVGIGTATLTGAPRLTVNGAVRAGYDADTASYFGRAAVGYGGVTDVATFSHIDQNATFPGIQHTAAGDITLNVATSGTFKITIGASTMIETTDYLKFLPGNNGGVSLGDSSKKWSEVWAVNGTIQTSDVRDKEDVAASDLGLAFVRALAPIRYRMRGGTRPHYGLAADQVRQALDDLGVADFAGYIHDAETDSLALRYTEFIGPLIVAVQDLADRLDALEDRRAQ